MFRYLIGERVFINGSAEPRLRYSLAVVRNSFRDPHGDNTLNEYEVYILDVGYRVVLESQLDGRGNED